MLVPRMVIKMAEFKYEIIEHLGVISKSPKGWTKELNKISWINI